MPVHLYTVEGDDEENGRVHAVYDDPSGGRTFYEFVTSKEGGEKKATLENAIGTDTDELPDAVRESIERDYTLVIGDGGETPSEDGVGVIREQLEIARDAAPGARDGHIKHALGEVMNLAAKQDVHTADLQEQLVNIIVAPPEEEAYFINRALGFVEDLEDDVDEPAVTPSEPSGDAEEPPESVRWIGEDTGVLEIEVTRPFVEWIELEVEQHNFDSVEAWVRTHLWLKLTNELQEKHGFNADVEVEVPHDYAQRVALWVADREAVGNLERGDVEAFLFNHMDFDPTWTIDGEPWELLEQVGGQQGECAE